MLEQFSSFIFIKQVLILVCFHHSPGEDGLVILSNFYDNKIGVTSKAEPHDNRPYANPLGLFLQEVCPKTQIKV